MNRIFVYGSLRKGGRPFDGEFVGDDRVTGDLYSLGWYPGARNVRALFNPALPAIVGEVYDVSDDVFKNLDEYEGCSYEPFLENTGLFHRKQVMTEGERVAWIYIYSGQPDGSNLVKSGDWLLKETA